MRNIWTIAEKEFKSIFHNAIAYVFGVVMFLSLGIYFMILLQYGMQTQTYVPDMRVLLDWVLFPIFFFGVPVLTMRSISRREATPARASSLEMRSGASSAPAVAPGAGFAVRAGRSSRGADFPANGLPPGFLPSGLPEAKDFLPAAADAAPRGLVSRPEGLPPGRFGLSLNVICAACVLPCPIRSGVRG